MKRGITKGQLILFAVILVVLQYLPTASVEEDGNPVSNSILGDIPVQLLPDEEVVRIFRESGYIKSKGTLSLQFNLISAMLGEGQEVNFYYLSREVLRNTKLLQEAFNLSDHLHSLEMTLRNKENLHTYFMERNRILDCHNRIYRENDRSPEIESILKQSLYRLKEIGFKRWNGKNLEVLADYYFSTGQNEKGLEYLEKALESYTESDHLPIASHLAGRIGAYHVRKGNLDEGEKAYMTSLAFARRMGDPLYLSRSLSFLGLLRATEGYFVEAESLLVQSRDCCDSINDPICFISKYLALARLHYFFGETTSASYLAEKAVLIAEESLKDPSLAEDTGRLHSITQYLATSLSLFSRIQLKQGDPEGAILNMNKAISISGKSVDRHFVAELEKLLGDIYSSVGEDEEAKSYYLRALKKSRDLGERRKSAEYLTSLAELHLKSLRYRAAENLLVEALALVREENYWMQEIESLHLLGKTAVASGDYTRGERLFSEAISIFDNESAGKRCTKDQNAVADRISDIYSDLFVLESDVFYNNDSLVLWAEKARHKPIGDIVLTGSDLVGKIESCITDRGWIPENAVVIQHLVTPERIIIISMDRYGTSRRSVEIKRETLENEILQFIDLCRSADDPSRPSHEPMPHESTAERAVRLYELIIEPLSAVIAGKDVLCFIEDGILRHLPLGALLQPGEDQRFLAERYTIMFSPSLIALNPEMNASNCESFEGSGKGFDNPLLVGNIEIPQLIKKIYPDIDKLPHTGREITAVEKLLPHSKVLLGPSATKEAILSRAASSDLIHIAAHTITYPVYGGRAAIVLSPAERISGEKNLASTLMEETDIIRQDLSMTKLVVLSTCKSALGKPAGEGGRSGLAQAFLKAGASSVVATLWPVEDTAAENLITGFFRELLLGRRTTAEALRLAQNRIINDDRSGGGPCRHIKNWAPFVLVGSFPAESGGGGDKTLMSNLQK